MKKHNPKDFGIPHDEFRSGQYELLQNILRSRGKYVFLSAPTGTGKSSIACGLGKQKQVLVLVHTLALLTQYERDYGFSAIRGKQEYDCINKDKVSVWREHYGFSPKASDCHFSPMHECPFAPECPYLSAKQMALAARRSVCTYRYAGVSSKMQARGGHVALDEAHDAAEELIGFNTFNLNVITMLPLLPFPIKSYGVENRGDLVTEEVRGELVEWLDGCAQRIVPIIDDTKEGADAQKIYDRFNRITEALFECDWFLRISDEKRELMALSAKHVAQKIFANKETKLLMSATIGNPAPLAKALGIDNYEFFEAEHPTPPAFRSVKDLKVPRMTRRNLDRIRELPFMQAELIWRWIETMPPEWRGLIVTTSYQKIRWLEENLKVLSKGKRRLIVQGKNRTTVSEAIHEFITDVKDGDILIGTIQGLGSGLDLNGDLARWVAVAGVPHKNPTDYYEQARKEQEGGINYQNWVTYNSVVQASGRVARGEKTENGNWLPNFCALADGSTTTNKALSFYPQWFLNAIKG